MNAEEIQLLDTIEHRHNENKWSPFSVFARYYGLVLGMFSGICFATCAFLVKLAKPTDPLLIVWFRSALQFTTFLLFCVYYKSWESIRGSKEIILIIVNSIFVTAALCLAFIAAQNIDVADANSIIFSAPLIVSVLAYFFLQEPCGYLTVVTVIIAVVGSLFSARPSVIFGINTDFTSNRVVGNACAFLSAISMSCYYVIIRNLADISSFLILCSSAATSLVTTSVYIAVIWPPVVLPITTNQILSVIAVAVFGIQAHLMLTKALQLERASSVSIFRMVDVPCCFLLQYIFLGQIPTVYSFIGAALICSSVIISLFSNRKSSSN